MGEQDAATRESAKVVDLAVREGFGPAIGLQLADIEQSVGGKFRRVASPAEIEAALLEAGPGARAVVAGARTAPDPGHVFNAVNVEGRVYFVDGQSGGAAIINDPTYVKWGMLQTTPRKP
jgi:hypothetical protein